MIGVRRMKDRGAYTVTARTLTRVLVGTLLGVAWVSGSGGVAWSQASLSPPSATDGGSALPDGGLLEPREPGLALPVDPGFPGAAFNPVQKTEEEIEAEIREDAFKAALTGLLPLEPPEIRRVLERYDQTREAVEVPIYPYPEPQVVVKDVPLEPGIRPVEIRLATGHVTTVNFLDISGAPWPIQDISWAGNFEVLQPESGSNVVRITPMSEFAYGNLSVRMVESKTPVTFVLKTHREGVYYRMDARLPDYGPLATPPLIDAGITIAAGSPTITAILDGVPPRDAVRLQVSGVDGRTSAYRHGGMVYVRTPLTLLSPAWTASTRSADGTSVYSLGNAPVLLLSDNGRMVRARLTDKETQQ